MTVTSTTRDAMTSFGLLILRLGIGALMATHGWGKVEMVLDGDLSQWQDPLGIGAWPSLVGAAFAEFVCSILVMAGLVTRFAAVVVVFSMGVAVLVVHRNDPLMMGSTPGSKEPALLYVIPFLALVFTGAGRYSLDALLFRRKVVAVKS